MSIALYATPDHDYFWALEIGQPEKTVNFGEGSSPFAAVASLAATQYQGAYFGCRAPANSDLSRFFGLGDYRGKIVDTTDEEDTAAKIAHGDTASEWDDFPPTVRTYIEDSISGDGRLPSDSELRHLLIEHLGNPNTDSNGNDCWNLAGEPWAQRFLAEQN